MMVTTATDVLDLQEKDWEKDKLGLSDQQIQKIKDNSVLFKPGSDVTVEQVFQDAISLYNKKNNQNKTFADYKEKYDNVCKFAKNAA